MSHYRRLFTGAKASLVAKLQGRARTLGTIMPAVAVAGLGLAWVFSSTSPTAIKVKVEPLSFASQSAPDFAPAARAATSPQAVQPVAQPQAEPLSQSLPELQSSEPQAVQPTVSPVKRLPRELERFAKRAAEPVESLPEIATRRAVAPSVVVAAAPKAVAVEPPAAAEVASAIAAAAALPVDPNAPLPEIATRKAVAPPVAVAEAPKPVVVEPPVAQGAPAVPAVAAAALPAEPIAPLPEIATRKAVAPVASSVAAVTEAEPVVTAVVAAGSEPSNPAAAAVTAAEPVVRLELLHTSAPRIRTAIPFTVKTSASVKPRDKVVIGRVPAGVTFSTGRPIGPGMWQVRVVDTPVTEMVVNRSAPADFTLTFMLLDASSMVVSGLEVAVAVQTPSIGSALRAAGPSGDVVNSVEGKTKRGQRKAREAAAREAEVREVKPIVVQRKSVEARAPAAALRYPGDGR